MSEIEFWEDSGDYLVISILKKRISNMEVASESFKKTLSDMGAQRTRADVSGERSIIKGAVIKGGGSFSGCVIKIVVV